MLHEFLEAACRTSQVEQEKRAFIDNLKKLPMTDLLALSEGKTVLAHMCGGGEDWIEKYKGTPLFEQALALEKSQLEQEVAREQQHQQDREQWAAQDQIRLQKRLLDLQLLQVQQQEAAAAVSAIAAPAGVPAALPTEAPKMASAWTGWQGKTASPKDGEALDADAWGRKLARADLRKLAAPTGLLSQLSQVGKMQGRGMTALAQGFGEKALKNMGTGQTIGTIAGGALGLGAGLQKDEQGNRHIGRGLLAGAGGALGGRMVGGMAGLASPAAMNAAKAVQNKQLSVGQAVKAFGQDMGASFNAVGKNLRTGELSTATALKPGPVPASTPKPAAGPKPVNGGHHQRTGPDGTNAQRPRPDAIGFDASQAVPSSGGGNATMAASPKALGTPKPQTGATAAVSSEAFTTALPQVSAPSPTLASATPAPAGNGWNPANKRPGTSLGMPASNLPTSSAPLGPPMAAPVGAAPANPAFKPPSAPRQAGTYSGLPRFGDTGVPMTPVQGGAVPSFPGATY